MHSTHDLVTGQRITLKLVSGAVFPPLTLLWAVFNSTSSLPATLSDSDPETRHILAQCFHQTCVHASEGHSERHTSIVPCIMKVVHKVDILQASESCDKLEVGRQRSHELFFV
jgi:hypothetical protein